MLLVAVGSACAFAESPAMKSILVVGHGPIGHSFIEKMTGDGCSYEISVLCEEPRPAYNRVMLTQYFEDRDGDKHLEVMTIPYNSSHSGLSSRHF